jgi:hypothetical protein
MQLDRPGTAMYTKSTAPIAGSRMVIPSCCSQTMFLEQLKANHLLLLPLPPTSSRPSKLQS